MAQANYGGYDQLSVASAEVFREFIDDNVFGSNLVAELGWETAEQTEPGRFLTVPILTGKNQTATAVGQYDEIDSSPQSILSAAAFPWSYYVVSLTLDYQSLSLNRGPNRRVDMMGAQVQTAIASLMDLLGNDLCSLTKGRSTKNGVNALGIFEATDDGTNVNVYGNIARTGAGSFSGWAGNAIKTLLTGGIGTATNDAPLALFYALYNNATQGAAVPDKVFTNKQGVAAYMYAMQAQQRFAAGDIANAGFAGAALFGARVIADDHILPVASTNVSYPNAIGCNFIAINSMHTRFFYYGEKGFDFVPWVNNPNVLAKTARYVTSLQYASSQPRTGGQLLNVNAVGNL